MTIFKHHFTLELLWIISKFVSVLQIVEMYLSKLCIFLWKFEIELIQSCNSKSNLKDYEIRGSLSLLVNKDWVSQLTLSPGVLFISKNFRQINQQIGDKRLCYKKVVFPIYVNKMRSRFLRTLWKNGKFTVTLEKFRQINSSTFFSKNVTFTKFLSKKCDSKFP